MSFSHHGLGHYACARRPNLCNQVKRVIVEQERIWDYFQSDGVSAFDGNYPRLSYLLGMASGHQQNVLNIGVGNGAFERLALKKGIKVYSLDPSATAIDRLRAELKMNEHAQVGYSQNMPFPDNHFGTVVISEVLEHLDDDVLNKTLGEIKRVLKAGGKIVGTVPSRENLQDQFAVCPKCGEAFHRWGHVQSFDKARLLELLAHNFSDVEVREKYFVFWRSLNLKGKVGAISKLILRTVGVHGQGENLVFRATKPSP